MTATPSYAAAVVGGGVVGGVCALLLARQLGASSAVPKVALLERQSEFQAGPIEPNAEPPLPIRHLALNPGSIQLLTELGLWQNPLGVAYTDMQVWEERGTAQVALNNPAGGAMGWVVEHDWLAQTLWQALHNSPQIEFVTGTELQSLRSSAGGIELACSTGPLHANLVIGADGANSAVRQLSDGKVTQYASDQRALATVVRMTQPHGGVARQRFLLDGPLALLPSRIPDAVSIVWTQSTANAERRQSLSEAEFAKELAQASDHVLGPVLAIGPRALFPVHQQLAARFTPRPGVVLVGDAARVIHPLAGQGVNAGLEDVAKLLQLAAQSWPIPAAAMQRYAQRRRVRSQGLIRAMQGLQLIYGASGHGAGWLRNVAVRAVGQSEFVKRLMVEQASGL